MSHQKKVLLNLDIELYEPMAADADKRGVSVTEWVRGAIRAKLDGPGAAPIVSAPLFDQALATAAEPTGHVAEQVQRPDKQPADYWLERIRQWRGMAPQERTAELMQATGGIRPPAELFSSADRLAKWLEENGK